MLRVSAAVNYVVALSLLVVIFNYQRKRPAMAGGAFVLTLYLSA